MSLKSKLEANEFIVTSEIGPPKGIALDKIIEEIMPIKNRVDAINVTDLQSAVMRLGSLASCVILKQNGFEPVVQFTCRDRNRLALQSDLLSAAAFGLENVLALTGDHPSLGDHPQAKPVYDIDSVHLVDMARCLRQGFDAGGHKLSEPFPKFCIGAVVNPGADPLEPEIIKMEKKMAAGAEFFQTQAIYDIAVFERFLCACRHLNPRILAGIVYLKSERMARYMNENVPGVVVPDEVIAQIARVEDKKNMSIEISVRLATELKKMCQGIHLMPIGWYALTPVVLDSIGK
ncbi:MAG: methylenetetrahydrofolate reductase [Candidatus Omnitrophota bacterium]